MYKRQVPYIYLQIADTVRFYTFYFSDNKNSWCLHIKRKTDSFTVLLCYKITNHFSGYCNTIVLLDGNKHVVRKMATHAKRVVYIDRVAKNRSKEGE